MGVLARRFCFDGDLGPLDKILVSMGVEAAITSTFGGADLARTKTLAISLEAFGLFAGTTHFFLLGFGSLDGWGVELLNLGGERVLVLVLGGEGVEAGEGVVGDTFDGFNHKKGILDSVEGWQSVE